MSTTKHTANNDEFLDLPLLLKRYPPPSAGIRSRSGSVPPPPANGQAIVTPPPSSAGYNPYFDLPPDAVAPSAAEPGGSR